jgi:peroxiredoxin
MTEVVSEPVRPMENIWMNGADVAVRATPIDPLAATIGCCRAALGLAAARLSKIERRPALIDRRPASPVSRCPWRIRTLLLRLTAASAIMLGSVELCRVDAAADEPATFDQARGAGQDSGEQTFILSFRGIDPFRPETAKELLDGFAERHEAGARTHHFRTEVKEGVLIGHLCVDGEAGKDALLSLLAASERVTLMECKRAAPEVLRRHMALGQPSLRGRGGGSRSPGGSRIPYPKDGGPLRFELFDAFGRKVVSDDYLGAPVLIMAGACWCGGCQQDAEQLRLVAEEYGPRGLRVIRSVSGDNELTAVEFQRHYRLPFVQLLDPNREFEMRYNRDGWTFLMVADKEGKVVYRANSADWASVRTVLDDVVAEGKPPRNVSLESVDYPPAVAARSGEADGPARRDRFPSVACSADGRVFVALTSNRNGQSDVFLRVFDGSHWSGDRPVAVTEADEYDGAVAVDRDGRAWVSWTSNAGSDQYNVFVARLSGAGEPAGPTRITRAEDDAMHARMACDERGRIWATYYKWRKMRGRSRDKEVYLRRFDGDDWSDEIRISPTDVPEYEDHFDPDVVATGDSAAVCWSWDYHRPPGYTKVPQTPTIFVRTVSAALQPGPIYAVSGRNTDTMPAIAGLPDGKICCAWESTVYERRAGAGLMGIAFNRRVSTSTVDPEGQERPGPGWNASGAKTNVCTPRLAVGPDGITALVWSDADAQGQWKLRSAFLKADTNRWSEPTSVVSEGNPRFPAAAFDADRRLWIAYAKETEAGRRIEVLGQDVAVAPGK